jgi:hypothetical protein
LRQRDQAHADEGEDDQRNEDEVRPAGVQAALRLARIAGFSGFRNELGNGSFVDLDHRFRGDLDQDGVLPDVVDPAVEPAGGHDLLATLETLEQLALVPSAVALGPDDQHPEEDCEHDEREELHSLAFR